MLAALAFEPFDCLGLRVEDAQHGAAASELDPELAELVRQIRRVEGETVTSPPLLFRFVEVCGLAIIGACASGIAALLA